MDSATAATNTSSITYHQMLWLYFSCAGIGVAGHVGASEVAGAFTPQLQQIVGDGRQIRLAAVRIHTNQRILAVRETDLVEACTRQLEGLCRGRLR